MAKYRLARERLQAELGGSAGLAQLEVSPLATNDELVITHDDCYVKCYLAGEFTAKENRRVGFPWNRGARCLWLARSLP